MNAGDKKYLRDEFIKRCGTQHPDGWEGAVREYAAGQNAIYEEWRDSVTGGYESESFFRFPLVLRYLLGWFRKR